MLPGKGVMIKYQDGTIIEAHSYFIIKKNKDGKSKKIVIPEKGVSSASGRIYRNFVIHERQYAS